VLGLVEGDALNVEPAAFMPRGLPTRRDCRREVGHRSNRIAGKCKDERPSLLRDEDGESAVDGPVEVDQVLDVEPDAFLGAGWDLVADQG
jgi:hypothetical protein